MSNDHPVDSVPPDREASAQRDDFSCDVLIVGVPASGDRVDARPIRTETRVTLINAIARGRRWMDELVEIGVLPPRPLLAVKAATPARSL